MNDIQQDGAVALAPIQHAAPVAVIPTTPAEMLGLAVQRGASIEQIDKLMDLMERHEKNQARKAFNEAKAAFAAESITITKDKENKQYGSTYTSIGNLVSTVRPFLGKHGLSANWDIDQREGIQVTCILSHELGHFEQVTMKVPQDTSGAKNPLQQIKSSVTYARAATFEAVCGLASTDEANMDDDGNGSGVTQEDRKDLRNEARQMRQRATPSEVANRGKPKPAEDSPEFLSLRTSARMAADAGRASFGEFWKELSGAKRNMIASELEDLQARVDKAEAPKAGK